MTEEPENARSDHAESDQSKTDLRRGLAATSLLALLPDWPCPPWRRARPTFRLPIFPRISIPPASPGAATRQLDIRKIDGMLTPKDQFFTTQHFMKPEIDPAKYRLKFTGMVNKPAEFSLADLKAMKSIEVVNGFECSGNSPRAIQGLSSCGKFTGVRLSAVLKQLGVNSKAREVVFFGYRSRTAGHRVPPADLQARTAVRPQHHAGTRHEARAAHRLRDEWRAAHAQSGIPGAAGHARLVRRGEREMARGSASAGRSLPRQLSGPLVPDPARRGRHRQG